MRARATAGCDACDRGRAPGHPLFLRSASIEWGAVPPDSLARAIPAVTTLDTLRFEAPVTLFAGENGTGKSTLLEALAVALGFDRHGGTRHYRIAQDRGGDDLSAAMRLTRGPLRPRTGYFFRAESFSDVARAADGYGTVFSDTGRSLLDRSHGEGFLDFLQAFDGVGLFLMDEPEAALSAQRQLALLRHIVLAARAGSQFVIASHSPILLGCPGAQILGFDDGRIEPIDYEQTESHRVTRLFLEDRASLLRHLLEEFR